MPRLFIAGAFLGAQIALVVASQFSEARWFSWAPHTAQVHYQLAVEIDGTSLDADQIRGRYGIQADGWEAHAIQNVKDFLIQHARTHGRHERTAMAMRYSVNGRPYEDWTWSREPDRP